ncbi:MAG: EamA/RhaT family transporter, partial [Deltaproteobacteria bacterium]|nr:EamA/RhaT family transporter [Deltaproteobacteria bacterium]
MPEPFPEAQAKGAVYIVLAALCWSTLGPVSKLAFAHGVAPLDVAFWRAVSGWALFAGQAAWLGQTRVRPRDLPGLAVFGFLGVSVFYGAYQIAVRDGGAALASVLLYTAPAWVALLARFFLGEGLTRIKIICILLSMAGVAGVAFGSGETQGRGGWPLLGVACGLVSGLTYASYYIFSKRFLRTYRAPTIFLYIQPFGALFLLPFLGGLPADAVAWASVLFLGL